jgi:4a-hydroxytetrahydrobiopterin dehydratase
MRTLLDDDTIGSWLAGHDAWHRDGHAIRRTIDCVTFRAAIGVVDAIADAAETRDHHPDIDIRWRTLHVALSTHSAGGITGKDLELAAVIDEIAHDRADPSQRHQ